jgi:hypothetical protein
MVKGEILTFGAAAGAAGAAYKLAEFLTKAKRVRDVGPSNAVYVRMIGRVRSDLDEVRRLLSVREIHDILEANPEKSKWVYGCMRDVRGALENITPHTERVAGDVEDGRRIGVRHRVYWLLSEKEKLANREKELVTAHTSLSEVLGYLTALEPVEEPHKPEPKHSSSSKKETHVDIDIHHEAPPPQAGHTAHIDREIWVERDGAPTKHFEEHRDVWVDPRDRQPQAHFEEHRDVYIDERERHRGPQHYDERGPPRHEPQYDQRGGDPRYEAQYDERFEQQDHYRSQYPVETHTQSRPFPEPLGRRPESYEDRLPERDSWMQSNARGNPRSGQYAEYGAPQPIGAAHYARRFTGDAGFGDEEILNPQPVPLDRKYAEREVSGYNYRGPYGSKL